MRYLLAIVFLMASAISFSQSTTVVISQVYGGGGSPTGTYNADYVELHNISTVDQDISGFKIMYGSSAGNLASNAASSYTFPITGVIIPAGGYLLVATIPGAGLANLPVMADYTFGIALSGTSGKVAFGNATMTSNTTYSSQPAGSVIDFIGYGTANEWETSACAGLTSTKAAFRNNNGCDDTNNNFNDFTTATPAPRSSATLPIACTSGPLLSAAPAITGLTTLFGVASAEQTFSVSGNNLTGFPGNIIVTAPANFEISLTSGSGFSSTINVPFSSASLTATTIYIRITSSAILGTVSGTISLNGGGASVVNLPASGSVLPNEPTTQASAITFSNVADNSMDINWTNGNGSSRIVVVHLTSSTPALPVDGLSYVANTITTSAGTTGTGNYVVYNGTGGGPISITNLTAGTNYTVNVYEYNGTTGAENYLTTTNTNNPNSISTTGISPVLQKVNFSSVSTPLYMGSGTSTRIPTMFVASLSNLTPNTTYHYYTQAATSADFGAAAGGAGNSILLDNTVSPPTITYSSSLSITTAGGYGKFTTNAQGSFTGSFGFIHTSNARFAVGNFVFPTITLTAEGNTFVQYRFALNDSIQVLQFAVTSGANDGTFIRGTSLATSGNLVALWKSVDGAFANNQVTERPLSMTIAEKPAVITGNGGSIWRTSFITGYDSTIGSWNTIVPNINNEGVRLIQQIDIATGAIIGCNSDADGTWPTGAINTTNPIGGTTSLDISIDDAPIDGGSCFKILPVKLSLFEVSKGFDRVNIIWQTAQEINMKEFILERSVDGFHWEILTTVMATGNNNMTRNYSATDFHPNTGINFYRLKSVSITGNYDYSIIKTILFKNASEILIAPNPATSFVNIYLNTNNNSQSKIQVFDISGKLMQQLSTNNDFIQINTSLFAKGLYTIKVIESNKVNTKSVIIQ